MFVMIIKLFVSKCLLLSHSICPRACKICVVFVETNPESNSRKLRKYIVLHTLLQYKGSLA